MDDEVNDDLSDDIATHPLGLGTVELRGKVAAAVDKALAPIQDGALVAAIKAAIHVAVHVLVDPDGYDAEQAEHNALVSRDEGEGLTDAQRAVNLPPATPEQALVDDDAKEEPLLDFAPPVEHEISGKLDF